MCGIAGLVLPAGRAAESPEGRDRCRAMCDRLAHRGPDAAGVWTDANVALGHRRLTIIDTSSAADQPMFDADRTVAVVYNGEIYNFHQLTRELTALGHRFVTHGDTEVLVHGWKQWGDELPGRLRGMFAFALYDRRRRRLLLARDRLGKKPLYYAVTADGLVLASEIKALLTHPAVGRELDPAAIGQYMVYGNAVGPGSVYAAIRSLPPGSLATVDADAPRPEPEVRRFWSFEPRPDPRLDPRLDEGAFVEELETVLREAVRLRLIADVPLGAFLSGGIDSSLVVALMAQLASGGVRTFAIGFDEPGWDESPHARAVAAHLGTDHREETVTPDAASMLPELVAVHDEPFADPSALPTWYVSRMTRRHVKVALSGDGGDEMFIGYQRYLDSAALERWGRRIGPPGRAAARAAAALLPTGSWLGRGLDRVSRRGFELYHHALGFSPVYRSLLAPGVAAALGEGERQKAAAVWHAGEGLGFLDRCRAVDVETYLPDQILVKVDRASMAHGLEVRCPLLDQEVAELAARMPAAAQVAWGRGPGAARGEGKRLLRRLAYRLLPRELLERPKQGFGVPLDRWFRGPLAVPLAAAVADPAHPAWRFFDRAAARRRLDHHRAGRADAGTALWRLLFFAAWAERNLD